MEKIFGLKGGGTINEGGCRKNSWVSKEDEAAVCRQQPRIPATKKIKLESEIKRLGLEKDKLLGEAEVVKKALDEYKPTTKQLVLPTVGEMGIKLETENEYYSKLIEQYIKLNTEASNKEYEIIENKQELEDIKIPTEEENARIQEMIKNLVSEINKITEEVNKLNKGFHSCWFWW